MLNRNLKLAALMILITVLARTGFAAYVPPAPGQQIDHYTYDSSSVGTPTTTARLFCYTYTMNNTTITNTVTSNNPAFDATQCIRLPYLPTVWIVGLVGGGALIANCPATHPYFHDRRQGWAFVASGNITAGTDAECCALPSYTASGTADWITPSTPGVCP